MSAIFENIGLRIPNPLRSTFIPPNFLADNAEERIRDSTTFAPFSFITTKYHATLPLSIHNYTHRSFWSTSPFSSYTPEEHTQIMDSETVGAYSCEWRVEAYHDTSW